MVTLDHKAPARYRAPAAVHHPNYFTATPSAWCRAIVGIRRNGSS
ncbi:MAG TPA: hypothetical protein VL997_04140 [Dyella sp.]|nr:hypothetical protein [Dyella sp.]